MRAALLTLALLLVPATAQAGTHLDALASQLSGTPVQVTCLPEHATPYDGHGIGHYLDDGSFTVEPHIWLKLRVCRPLVRLIFWRQHHDWMLYPPNVQEAAYALTVMNHEAMHVRLQSADEGLVECTSIRNIWPAVTAFHLPRKYAGIVLADAIYDHQTVTPLRNADGSPDPYRSVC